MNPQPNFFCSLPAISVRPRLHACARNRGAATSSIIDKEHREEAHYEAGRNG
jgi:hypothetical protein